jgi:hypothetical protein
MAVSLKERLTHATLLIARRPMVSDQGFSSWSDGRVGSTAETNRLFVEAGDDRMMSSLVGCVLAEVERD